MCVVDGVLSLVDEDGETRPLELPFGHITRLAFMHQNSNDKASKMVLKYYVENMAACAVYGTITDDPRHYDSMIYMLTHHRELDEVEQIIRSNKVHGFELHEAVSQVLKASYAMYGVSDSGEEVEDSRLLAAHACLRMCDAYDSHLYFQQNLAELYESNYSRAMEILYTAVDNEVSADQSFICY